MERRSPAVCKVSDHKEGKDEMTKASVNLQDLRRRIYVKAKAETSWRFWDSMSMSASWTHYARRMRWPNAFFATAGLFTLETALQHARHSR